MVSKGEKWVYDWNRIGRSHSQIVTAKFQFFADRGKKPAPIVSRLQRIGANLMIADPAPFEQVDHVYKLSWKYKLATVTS